MTSEQSDSVEVAGGTISTRPLITRPSFLFEEGDGEFDGAMRAIINSNNRVTITLYRSGHHGAASMTLSAEAAQEFCKWLISQLEGDDS